MLRVSHSFGKRHDLSAPCSMSIIYGVFSASNLMAPSVVAVIGPQLSMFFSGLLYRYVTQLTGHVGGTDPRPL